YAALSSNPTKTVVRQVTVTNAQPAANASTLSVNEIYTKAYKGVVEITVTTGSSSTFPFGDSQSRQAEGSGFVYDNQGDIVTDQHDSDSGGNNGVGFAIPSNTVGSIASQLIAKGTVEHAYLGVQLGTTAKVQTVVSGTPAAHAGLHVGDVITAVDGKSVSSA